MTLFTFCRLDSNNKDNPCFTFDRTGIQGSLPKSVLSVIGFNAIVSFLVSGRVLIKLFVESGAGMQPLLFANLLCSMSFSLHYIST